MRKLEVHKQGCSSSSTAQSNSDTPRTAWCGVFALHCRSLELLQTEDLERVASLPLFEERYQRLTNVTFLELMKKLYDFGLTQVRAWLVLRGGVGSGG